MIRMRVRLVRALPFFIVLGVGFGLWYVTGGFALGRAGHIGPEVWPRAILVLLIASAIMGAIQALVRGIDEGSASALIKSATRAVGREGEIEAELQIEAGDPRTRRPLWAGVGIALMLGFVAVVPFLGFTLTTFLLMYGVIWSAGYRRPLIAGVTAAAGTFAFFAVFQRLVYVSLPLGVGPFKDLSTALMAALGVK
jgi:putative tricarboxylic transport membrane protein